jgi:aspartate/methionine/tyrosine aminotransferase
MTEFKLMDRGELEQARESLVERYRQFQARSMNLDMTRGKPCAEQLDLSMPMLEAGIGDRYISEEGTDCRNYGGLDGIGSAKELFAEYLSVTPEELIIGGNSSLNLMHDTFVRAMLFGVGGDAPPWGKLPRVRFLCPSPGYDRHFSICEFFGIEMLPVEMGPQGPDMDQVESLVASDDGIKGIWCVPKYSNPTGIVYSDDVVRRLAAMPTRADDFRIFWDNAYAVHFLGDGPAPLGDILEACKAAGHPDRVYIFGSTSKITFASGGVAMLAASIENQQRFRNQISFQTIGPDKLTQLRHVLFFKNTAGIIDHMHRHAAILRPKFDAVQSALETELGGKGIAEWTRPEGGYFVSIDTMKGCAGNVIAMAAEAGVKLTPAGSTFPLKRDPADSNMRIAPSFPPLDDIRAAMELVGICIQLVAIDKLCG